MKNYLYFFQVLRFAEILACLSGLITWKKWRGTPWRLFTLYLAVVVAIEYAGAYTLQHDYNLANKVIYLFESLIELWIAFSVFYLLNKGDERRLAVVCAIVYTCCWLAETLFIEHLSFIWNSFAYTIGIALLLILILRFLIRLATSEQILRFNTNMMFWVSTGWLLFYTVTLPYYGLHRFLAPYQEIAVPYSYVVSSFNTIMYLLFAAGFLCSRPE